MNNYIWSRKDVDLLPEEIAPWKLPRDKHATISVLKHRLSELHTVDDYLSRCEQEFEVEYVIPMHGTTEQAWEAAKAKLNAQLNKRMRNVVLECLQFGGNKEFWDGFPNEYEIEGYFKKCYSFAVDKIGYLGTEENIIGAMIITEPNRRNLFVYYLPVTPKWKAKIMSKDRNDYGTLLQLTDENGEPLYSEIENFDSPLLCRTEFWKQRGGVTSFSDLQEDFFKKISEKYSAVRGKSTSPVKNTCLEQRKRFRRYEDDKYDFIPDFDDMPYG
jgi:hypothetical protein